MNTNAKKPVPAVERMRRLRARRRNGFRSLRVLLHDMDIDSLVDKGFLKPERRQEPPGRFGGVKRAPRGNSMGQMGQRVRHG